MMINGELYARVTPQKFDRLYEAAKSAADATSGAEETA